MGYFLYIHIFCPLKAWCVCSSFVLFCFLSGLDSASQAVAVQNMLMSLPEENYVSLRFLVQFLAQVSKTAYLFGDKSIPLYIIIPYIVHPLILFYFIIHSHSYSHKYIHTNMQGFQWKTYSHDFTLNN